MTHFPDQFGSQYGDPFTQPMGETRKTSGLAITALVFSLIGIVPCCGAVSAPLGFLLGLISYFRVRSSPTHKGKGIAIAATVIGLIFTATWVGVVSWSYVAIGVPMQSGPREAMRAGFGGDYAGFKSHFFGAAATASDSEIQSFIEQLRDRYGEFKDCHENQSQLRAKPPTFQQMMQPVNPHPYRFVFGNKTIDAIVETSLIDPQTGQFLGRLKFGTITIYDPDLSNLTYPPGASPAGSTPGTASRPAPAPGSTGASNPSASRPHAP